MTEPIDRRRLLAGIVTLGGGALSWPRAVEANGSHIPAIRSRFVMLRGALPVPSISIPLMSGQSIDMTRLRGSVVVVNFWATWCPGCREELPALQRLASFKRPDVQVLAIAADREPKNRIAEFSRTLGVTKLTIGLAPEGLLSRKDSEQSSPFALYGMPITYLIGPAGDVRGYVVGLADWSSHEAIEMINSFL